MTEPKAQHPMFEGRRIDVGDEVTLKPMKVVEMDGSSMPIYLELADPSADGLWVQTHHIAKVTPAPRPLVPGPAEYINTRDRFRVTVVAVHNGQAWVKMPDGVMDTEIHLDRLRNTEGAPS